MNRREFSGSCIAAGVSFGLGGSTLGDTTSLTVEFMDRSADCLLILRRG